MSGGRISGSRYRNHIITVNPGEDASAKILSFSLQSGEAICINSAYGVISSVKILPTASTGETITYEGHFEILSLSGSLVPITNGGEYEQSGGINITFSRPNGHLCGGAVAGVIRAATAVKFCVREPALVHQWEGPGTEPTRKIGIELRRCFKKSSITWL
ncbi:AT-hook motif nuclear-localized protein 1-like [Tripterygium wilfordii]|uniref:AT-hook motif nuclear-localized protein 1-like n=1 Tax=Tripterygium wilfordii TaxID=458696 RepID=UPI0018F80CBC|nr:AT-hook motif nuclear-localized protein 1-like [Tripterygium wilfordii]